MYTRKKQYITLAILVAAVITLSIGFAAFSNLLTINSEATVTPDQGNFKVVFSNANNRVDDEDPVTVTKTPNSISTTNGVIDNTSEPTLTNLSATFTEPGQKVEYDLYVYNAGAYVANLNSVTFRGTKSCTPQDNTVNYVDQACNSISMTVKVGNSTYTQTTQNITGHSLSVGGYEPVKVTIEYASNGVRADGPFSVSFPDVSLYYNTVSGVNEEVASPYVYALPTDFVSLNSNVSTIGTTYSKYEDLVEDTGHLVFIRYKIESDIITEAALGFVIDNTPYYLIGGVSYAENLTELAKAFPSCPINANNSQNSCGSQVGASVMDNGSVTGNDASSNCAVGLQGMSFCQY